MEGTSWEGKVSEEGKRGEYGQFFIHLWIWNIETCQSHFKKGKEEEGE
jgi:hypothetical protein